MVLENSFGRTILPLGMLKKSANIPGRMATHPIDSDGMPGVRVAVSAPALEVGSRRPRR